MNTFYYFLFLFVLVLTQTNCADDTTSLQLTEIADLHVPTLTISQPSQQVQYLNVTNHTLFFEGVCSEYEKDIDITGSKTETIQCSKEGTWSTQYDLSEFADGTLTFNFSHKSKNLVEAKITRTFILDTQSPSIAISSPAPNTWINQTNVSYFTITGTCSEEGTDNITISGSSSGKVSCHQNSWTANLNMTGITEALPTITFTHQDAAGNTSVVSRSFQLKTSLPSVSIDNLTSTWINLSNVSSFPLEGGCSDDGMDVNISVGNTILKTLTCTANRWSGQVSFPSTIPDGHITVTITHTDLAGNSSSTTNSDIQKDTARPSVGFALPLENVCMNTSSATGFTITGTCTSTDGDVTLSSSYFSTTTTACTSNTFTAVVTFNTSGLINGDILSVSIRQTDTAGNNSTPTSRNYKYYNGTPSVTHQGWEDVYSIGKKTYADGTASENGVLKIKWYAFSGDCVPEKYQIMRATASAGPYTQVGSDLTSNIREFEDTTISTYSAAYYYRVYAIVLGSQQLTNTETIRVIAPPDNMALVHRWIANQEMCALMGLSSLSQSSGPTNNYRCAYTGWGQTSGYYDLGSDLLVDRFEAGCEFSRSSCGVNGGGINDCYASANLDSSGNPISNPTGQITAQTGKVYYDNLSTDGCYYATYDSGTGLTTWTLNPYYSNKAHNPLMVGYSQVDSATVCSLSKVTLTNLGSTFNNQSKRLLRNNEVRAASAWSSNLSNDEIDSLESGSTLGYCNTNNRFNDSTTLTTLINSDQAYKSGNKLFLSGSKQTTSMCQSRYGIQDIIGNGLEWASDQLNACSSSGNTCVGITSNLDSSNTWLQGFIFDGLLGPGGSSVTSWMLFSKAYESKYFSIPLALPMLTSDSNNVLVDNFNFHSDAFYINTTSNPGAIRALMYGGGYNNSNKAGRWYSNWASPSTAGYSDVSLRCTIGVP